MAVELLQCCHKQKVPTLALKLDFRKAFDSVEWSTLNLIMRSFGFSNKWSWWMNHLLQTERMDVLLNGVLGRWIQCKRGLRQGDPLSLYLFLIEADMLQRLITRDGSIRHALDLDMSCPIIQYADDTLILLPADGTQLLTLKTLLDHFASATGLQINYYKSTFVPIHVPPEKAMPLASILGCNI